MTLFFFISWIISFFSYFYAPNEYSYSFCSFLALLYILTSFVFLKKTFKNGNYFNFHLFFLISFFVTNYVYPIFLYPINPYYFTIFKYSFNHDLISRGTALAQLGANSYIVGAIIMMRKNITSTNLVFNDNYNIPKSSKNFSSFLSVVSSLLFIGYVFFIADEVELNSQFVNVVIVFFTIAITFKTLSKKSIYKNNLRVFLFDNKYLVMVAVLIIGSSLWYGDRGPAIQIFFISSFIFTNYLKRVKFSTLLLLIVFGFVAMTFVSSTRDSEHNLKNSSLTSVFSEGVKAFSSFESNWDFGMDLISNSRNLYVGMEYVEKEGFLNGRSYFPQLFILIPGLPTYMTEEIYNVKPESVSSSRIITDYSNAGWGLGTNAIVDIYMNFGLIGVVVLFFLFGILIIWLEKKNTIYSIVAYLLIFALAIYYPRASIFEQSTLVIRALVIVFVLLNVVKKKRVYDK